MPPSFTNRLMRAKHSPAHGGGLPLWRCAAGRCCVRSVCMEGHAAGSECSSRSGRSLQNPELPNGCEAASLAALLKYKGVPADKLDLAYGYIPRGDIEETTDGRTGPDPELAYAGDPAAGLGFYCFAQPVAQGANAYLAAQGSALRAADITGVTGQGLLQYLRGGDPVIVWITKDLSAPRTGGCTWLLADTGETYVPYVNLHCVVLAGWDGDTCTIADPLQGRRRVDAAAFLQCFRQMGSRAVVVH